MKIRKVKVSFYIHWRGKLCGKVSYTVVPFDSCFPESCRDCEAEDCNVEYIEQGVLESIEELEKRMKEKYNVEVFVSAD